MSGTSHASLARRAPATSRGRRSANCRSQEISFWEHASNDGKVMIFSSGVPVMNGDAVIEIGVSGGLGKRYQAVAEAGAERPPRSA